MTRFLSPEWIELLDISLQSAADLSDPSLALVVEQHVAPLDGSEIVYHLDFSDGSARARPGPSERADIRLTQDLATATLIARGELSAQRAFMTGRLRVGGDLQVLVDQGEMLSRLSDAFADLRGRTTFEDPEPGEESGIATANPST